MNGAAAALNPPKSRTGCTYRIAFGPRAGQKMLTVRAAMPRDADIKQTLCADIDGFSLHAAVRCSADDRQAQEQLCRYITRPPCRPRPASGRTPRQAQTVHRTVCVRARLWPTSACKPTPPGKSCSSVMTVAPKSAVHGQALPLVVVSHGTGSSFLGHPATAAALADAGYVVVAVTHTGDNYADQSRSVFIMERPQYISRAIDHMLSTWENRSAIDATRIGAFGYSAGGFTTLVSEGGIPDFSSFGPICQRHPGDFACQLVASPAPARRRPGAGQAPATMPDSREDVVLPHPRYAEAARKALPEAPVFRIVANAGHFDFMPPCSKALSDIAPAVCTSAPGFDRAAFQQTFNEAVIAFFGRALKPGQPG